VQNNAFWYFLFLATCILGIVSLMYLEIPDKNVHSKANLFEQYKKYF